MKVLKLKEVIQLIKIIKRLCRFLWNKRSLIIFIIFAIIFTILVSKDLYDEYEAELRIKNTNILSECTITEPLKSYEELLEENRLQKIELSLLTEKCNQLEYENNTYLENQNNVVKNIDTANMNPHSKSNLTIEEIDKMLVGTGLESQGVAFYDMEQTYNVNALFAMGVAMHESARGYKKANTHNYFGFRGNNGWMSFSSAYDCIQYFGKLISTNYSNKQTISAIQSKYCPDGSPWTNRVISHMNQLKQIINA